MAYINGLDRNQVQMINASLDDFIAQDNPVRVIDAYVNSLDLKKLGFIVYDGNNKGQAPYRCSDLLKLHIYGYMNKVRSSRSLEAEAKRNLELMWLVNGITPDHGTIAGFVKKNKKAFHQALRDLTLILKGWGLIDGKLVAIDGTKIRAQNSKSNCITLGGLEKKIAYAEEQIEAYLIAIAQQEENEVGLREQIEVYQQMKETDKAQQEELRKEGLEQITLTDPDSRRMKNNGAMDVCYNVQAVIDGKNHFAIEAEATSDINDLNQLSHMAQKAKDLVQPDKMTSLSDTGYYNKKEIKACVDAGITVYVKKGKSNNGTNENGYRKDRFSYDAERDVYICPEGMEMPFYENTSKNGMKYRKYKCLDCQNCPKKQLCTASSSGRMIQRWEYEDVIEKVVAETMAHHDIYKQRRCIVEHPFGTIKRQLGYTYFLRRGIENVDAECASMFIAYNLKRLLGMLSVPDLVKRFVEYGRKARCTLREIVYFLFSEVIFSENEYETVPSCLRV